MYELVDNEDQVPPPLEPFAQSIKRFDKQTQATVEKMKEINLGTKENPKMLLISAELKPEEQRLMVALLK